MAAKKKITKKKVASKKAVTPPEKLPDTKIGQGNGISAGRPKGAKNKTTLVKEAIKGGWDDLMMTKALQVFNKTVDMALDGDTQCIKMIMDRAVPVSKAVDINASDIGKTGGITIHIEKLVAETGNPDEVLIEDGVVIEE